MGYTGMELTRISAEYERRAREIPQDFYRWNKPGNLLIDEQMVRGCIKALDRSGLFPLDGRAIADIGCGDGTWLLEFMQWGAEPGLLSGIDLSAERLARARARVPQADLRIGSASNLPWADESFDLVTQFKMFTSILDSDLKRTVAREMRRVLRPMGAILWFDFRIGNPSNPHVRGVSASEIRSLFDGCRIELFSVLLAPPLARLVAGWSRPLAEMLHAVPALRTHYVGLIRKP